MTTLGELLSQLVGWLGEFVQFAISFVPRLVIVRANERVLKYRGGLEPVTLEPKRWPYWYWPWITAIVRVDVTRCLLVVEPFPVETADGQLVAMGMAVSGNVTDVKRYDFENWQPDDNMRGAMLGATSAIAREFPRAKLSGASHEGSQLELMLRRRMGEALERFGYTVEVCIPIGPVALSRAFQVFGIPKHEPVHAAQT